MEPHRCAGWYRCASQDRSLRPKNETLHLELKSCDKVHFNHGIWTCCTVSVVVPPLPDLPRNLLTRTLISHTHLLACSPSRLLTFSKAELLARSVICLHCRKSDCISFRWRQDERCKLIRQLRPWKKSFVLEAGC